MVFCGLDLAINHSGIVFLDEHGKFISSELIKPPKKLSRGGGRLSFWLEYFNQLFKRYDNIIIGIEKYAFPSIMSKDVVVIVGTFVGIVQLSAYLNNVEDSIYLITPTQIKKFMTSGGKGEKDEVMKAVYKDYGVDLNKTDETDSFGAAQIRYGTYLLENGLIKEGMYKKYQLEVLDVVLKGNKKE
jgi:Holliday junction resolvasome RuvABC endonuclease subunit